MKFDYFMKDEEERNWIIGFRSSGKCFFFHIEREKKEKALELACMKLISQGEKLTDYTIDPLHEHPLTQDMFEMFREMYPEFMKSRFSIIEMR